MKHEDSPLMTEHLGKYRSLFPSLALIFHLMAIADGGQPGPVSENAALLAEHWCEYLEGHARRVYSMTESPEHEAAVKLAGKITTGALPNPFTAKSVYDKCWHLLGDREAVESACDVLIEENWLIMVIKQTTEKGGRPPLPEYFINPECL